MRFDLTSFTDAGTHALFDPGAVEPLPEDSPFREWEAWVRRLESTGSCLTYNEGGDGDTKLKLVVDEPFDDPGQTRSRLLSGAVLRVPTGRLHFAGIEYVFWDGHPKPNLKAAGAGARVPPGNYAVEGFHVDWSGRGPEAERERDAMLQPGDRQYARRFDGCIAPLCVLTILAAAVSALLMLCLSGRPWASKLAWAAAAACVAAAAVAMLWLTSRSPRMDRWAAADETMWKRYPQFVVILTPLPDAAPLAGFAAARILADATDEEAAS